MKKDELNQTFKYENGMLIRLSNPNANLKVGAICGTKKPDGYRAVSFKNRLILEHRVIWTMHFGEIPNDMFIDHINQVKDDNRIENLRLCNKSENQYNRPKYLNNKSGYKGVSFHKANGKFSSQIRFKDRKLHLGFYKKAEDAYNAYKIAANVFCGDFVNV